MSRALHPRPDQFVKYSGQSLIRLAITSDFDSDQQERIKPEERSPEMGSKIFDVLITYLFY
jgi:hypothetical protein